MTVRTRPAVRQSRAPWNGPERRTFLTNVGFGLVIVLAIAGVVIAAALTWYNQHLAPLASVNGQNITRDEFVRRADVEAARLSIAQSRIHDEFNYGRLSAEQRDGQLQWIEQQRQNLGSVALERLIDARIQADIAAQEGVAITDADVQAQITQEATRPEQRFAWIIEVAPKVEADAGAATPAAKAAAKATAEKAWKDLQAGKDWVEVAKAVSTDSTAAEGGELGWMPAEFGDNEAFAKAVFALETGKMTELLVDADGVYRIGRVTEIVPATVDPDYKTIMAARGVPPDVYEAAVRQDVLGEKLRETIEARALAEGPHRRVAEIYLADPSLPDALPEGSVKTRHILFAPKDDPTGSEELPEDDPAWKAAEDAARAAYNTLKTFPERFDAMAREQSDETGADLSGGKLPWFNPSQVAAGQLDPDFGAAIFKPGLQPLQLLEPVRSSFGWHVIQISYYPTDEDQAKRLKAQIEAGTLEWADAAREYSDADGSAEGGELGWVARYQLDDASVDAIFATPVGKITDPVLIADDGVHLYQVLEEATRQPTAEEREKIEQEAFSAWYRAKRAAYAIDRQAASGGN